MQSTDTKSDRFRNRFYKYVSTERLMLMRNLCYGGAAACTVILLGLIQGGAKTMPLQISTLSIAVALPLWLLLGSIYEFYIFLGKESYLHYRKDGTLSFFHAILVVAGLGMAISVGGIIYSLMPAAAYVFGAVALVSIILGDLFKAVLQRWWFGFDGPGSKTDEYNDG